MRNALESVHFYRRVPRDLSKGSAGGGLLSLAALGVILYLFLSDLAAFFRVTVAHEVRLDQVFDHEVRVNVNLTMHRMPCELASLDIFDVMGASVHNLTYGIRRMRVGVHGGKTPFKPHKRAKVSAAARLARRRLSSRDREREAEREQDAARVALGKARRLDSDSFPAFIKERPLSLVLFGAHWCEWTQRLLPRWAEAEAAVKADGVLEKEVSLGVVDCASRESRELCIRHHLQYFPAVHLYHRESPELHQNYIGPREEDSLLEFLRAAAAHAKDVSRFATPMHANAVHSERGREGCELSGSFYVARVPGSLRVAAHSPQHTFNPRWIDVDHTVHSFSFGVPDVLERRVSLARAQKLSDLQERQIIEAHERGEDPGTDSEYVHVEHLAFLPQYSRGSEVRPFRASKKRTRLQSFLSTVDRLKRRFTQVEALHRNDTHGPNSLGGRSFTSDYAFVSTEHYLKVVPTTYVFLDGDELDSYVYTVNNRETMRGHTPTVVFSYDVSPLRLHVVESRTSLAAFLTQCCAIIGGVFTVAGMLDGLAHHGSDLLARKMRIGKGG